MTMPLSVCVRVRVCVWATLSLWMQTQSHACAHHVKSGALFWRVLLPKDNQWKRQVTILERHGSDRHAAARLTVQKTVLHSHTHKHTCITHMQIWLS